MPASIGWAVAPTLACHVARAPPPGASALWQAHRYRRWLQPDDGPHTPPQSSQMLAAVLRTGCSRGASSVHRLSACRAPLCACCSSAGILRGPPRPACPCSAPHVRLGSAPRQDANAAQQICSSAQEMGSDLRRGGEPDAVPDCDGLPHLHGAAAVDALVLQRPRAASECDSMPAVLGRSSRQRRPCRCESHAKPSLHPESRAQTKRRSTPGPPETPPPSFGRRPMLAWGPKRRLRPPRLRPRPSQTG